MRFAHHQLPSLTKLLRAKRVQVVHSRRAPVRHGLIVATSADKDEW
ncbi:hypothetical protein EDD30_0883 [Couchioplanes caeruleus]|uniref:Uncharacterized protein n=1 Tax=Couchioplanes caeruleus TaxID=56438 RepID=A0A3N1GD27_9ACTN|nr:hypothetical protein EDD30_0883 [Couchioplanes caeruleus]